MCSTFSGEHKRNSRLHRFDLQCSRSSLYEGALNSTDNAIFSLQYENHIEIAPSVLRIKKISDIVIDETTIMGLVKKHYQRGYLAIHQDQREGEVCCYTPY